MKIAGLLHSIFCGTVFYTRETFVKHVIEFLKFAGLGRSDHRVLPTGASTAKLFRPNKLAQETAVGDQLL